MIKILFVCHGRILSEPPEPRKYRHCEHSESSLTPVLTPFGTVNIYGNTEI